MLLVMFAAAMTALNFGCAVMNAIGGGKGFVVAFSVVAGVFCFVMSLYAIAQSI